MRGLWWKLLGVVLLLYVFLAGLTVPLKPGIVSVYPQRLGAGTAAKLEVTGYNSYYQQAGSNRAWLKVTDSSTDYLLPAERVTVSDDRHLEAFFSVPSYLPTNQRIVEASLILDNPVDGPSVLPAAVFLRQDSAIAETGKRLWTGEQVAFEEGIRRGMTFPFRNILSESIRNTYFHVPLWFAMIFLLLAAVVYSIRYLRTNDLELDRKAAACTRVGILYGLLGLVTGAIWAKNTWGAYWSFDVKQNMTAIALLIYLAYFILRAAFDSPERRGRLSAVYSIFAFTALIPLIYVIPRLTDSLHPGAGGNPALGGEDLDNTMRLVFYPAIIGWSLLGFWIAQLSYRLERSKDRLFLSMYDS